MVSCGQFYCSPSTLQILLQLSHFMFVGSAVIGKLLRMQMLSDDDEFLSSEAAGDK